MLIYIYLITSLCCGAKAFSQGYDPAIQPRIDSLKSELLKPDLHDTTKINLLYTIGEETWLFRMGYWDTIIQLSEEALKKHENKVVKNRLLTLQGNAINNMGYLLNQKGETKKALEYYFKSLAIDKQTGNSKGIATSYNNIGYFYQNSGDMDSALTYLQKSLSIREQINDKEGMGESLNNLGLFYNQQGNIEMALACYSKSITIYEAINDKKSVARSFNNMAMIYSKQDDHEQAINYFNKALHIEKEIGNTMGIAYNLNNLGSVYENQKKLDTALIFYKQSLVLRQQIGNPKMIATTLNNIGHVYRNTNQLDSALHYFNNSLEIRNQLNYKKGIATTLNNIAELYWSKKEYKQAREFANRSYKLAQEAQSAKDIMSVARTLKEIAQAENNYEEALNMYELHITMRDSIKNEETQKATIRQQTKYEFEKAQLIKEQQEKEAIRIMNEKTQRRNNLQYSMILVAILAVFGTILALGFVAVSPKIAEGLIFFAFLIFFEFLLVLSDPYIDNFTGGAPAYKLLANALLAALIFPLHAFFETLLKKKIIANK